MTSSLLLLLSSCEDAEPDDVDASVSDSEPEPVAAEDDEVDSSSVGCAPPPAC
jgi:hypothetical protein